MSTDERGLVPDEGVDEGSSASAAQDRAPGGPADLLGAKVAGEPENGEQNAAPEPVGTGQPEPPGPGQRQQVGEG